jgi:hypothetical protein
LQFAQGEGEQGEHGGATGEALGDGLHQLELAGAGEEEPAHALVGIDDSLEVGEEVGNPLDFIEDGSIGDLPEESAGVLRSEGAGVGILQGKVGKVGGEEPGKGGFSRLARAGDGEDRMPGEAAAGGFLQPPWDGLVRA